MQNPYRRLNKGNNSIPLFKIYKSMEIIQSGPQSKSEGNILNAKGIQRTNRNTEVQQKQTPMSTTCTSKVVNCREVLKKKKKIMLFLIAKNIE